MSNQRPQSWTKDQRSEAVPIGPYSRDRSGCFKGIWNQDWLEHDEDGKVKTDVFTSKILQNREETCFFVEHQDGMTFEAAEDLQRLHYENRHLSRGYRDTQKSLRVAIVGIILSALFAGLNFLLAIYEITFSLPKK